MIVGREAELAVLHDALDQVRDGRESRVVTLVGDPGMGKTALLDALLSGAVGSLAVHLTGTPSEVTWGYAGLATLVRALSAHLDALPPRQRRAADTCLAVGDADADEAVDLLALGSALITLMAEAASDLPLVLVIDDVQWVDPESRRAIGFAVRRLSTERVLVVLAARSVDALPDGLPPPMEVGPLTADSVRALLLQTAPDLPATEAARIVQRARGNPLVAVERGRAATAAPGQVRDDEPLDEHHDRVFAAEVEALEPTEARALLLAVCDGRVDVVLVAEALARSGAEDATVDALLARRLLVRTSDGVALRHPLLADAVIAGAGPAEVRAAHALLADALDAHDDGRALWHRAQSAVGPDDDLALRIGTAADRAREQGRPDEASLHYELAARLTLDPGRRAGWYVDAAEAAFAAGGSARAERLVALAEEQPSPPPLTSARVQALLGQVGLRLGWRRDLGDSVVAACRHLPRDGAVPLLLRVARLAVGENEIATARDAVDLLDALDGGSPEFRALVRAQCAAQRDDPEIPVPRSERLASAFAGPPPAGDFAALATIAALAMEWGHITLARDLYRDAEEAVRSTGDVDDISLVAYGVAFCDHTLGAWNSAYARALEVSQLLRDADLPQRLSESLLLQAEIDAARGQDRCRPICAQARDLSETLVDPLTSLLADRREALLDLGTGRLDAAAARLESARAFARLHDLHHPYASPLPDLVEAYVRLGRPEPAADVAAEFLARVGPGSPPLPRARALRVAGLMATGQEYDAAFTESVELDVSVGLQFHAARTLLCHGERLRRDGRRVEARSRLHRGLDIFRRLEAVPWVERCEVELAASGETVTTSVGGDLSVLLTPQELQVALLAAEGRRNREIAETLYLSSRTVESHLSRVFRKLGVDNRTQLARRVSSGQD